MSWNEGLTGDRTGDGAYSYAAFISYRHAAVDRWWARWLHRGLETYRTPGVLARAGVRRRVGRCFRDEEELSASADLNAEIERALAASEFLIVVCSPRTPASRWVNREVERFVEMGRADRVLALLIEGEPADSFPAALRGIGSGGAAGRLEPLAADVRAGVTGERAGTVRRLAKLRLAAAVLGVTFDDLRRRAQERRQRVMAVVAAGLMVLVAVLSLLSVYALTQRGEAIAQRDRATTQEAATARKERERSAALARMIVQRGVERMEANDLSVALLYFARARQVDDGPLDLARCRAVLRGVPRRCDLSPAARAVRPVGEARRVFGVSAEGRLLVMRWAGAERALEVVDAGTGRAVGAAMRQDDELKDAEFSDDGTRVVTASADGAARVWEVGSGRAVTPPMRHGAGLDTATFSPDGRRVLTAGGTTAARIWDAASGAEATPALAHARPVKLAAFSPDGRRVVTADEGELRVWDAASGRATAPPLALTIGVTHAAFSPDGSRLLITTHGFPGMTGVRDAAMLAEVRPLGRGSADTRLMWTAHGCFSADGARVAICGGGMAHVFDAADGSEVSSMADPMALRVAFAPDGRTLATFGKDGAVRVWDAASGRAVASPVFCFARGLPAFGEDGALLLSRDAGTSVNAFAMPGGRDVVRIGGDGGAGAAIKDVAFSPDGLRVVTAGANGARVWDVATGRPLTGVMGGGAEGATVSAAFSADGARVLTVAERAGGRVWDAWTGRAAFDAGPDASAASPRLGRFSADGRRFLVLNGDQAVIVRDARTGAAVGPAIRTDVSVEDARFSPDGARVVTTGFDYGRREPAPARAWDAASGEAVGPPLGPAGDVFCAAFGADGSTVLVGLRGGFVRVLDARTGAAIGEPLTVGEMVIGLEVDAARGEVLTRTPSAVRVWELASRRPTSPPMAIESARSAQFGAGGRRVHALGQGVARAWDARSGQPLGPALRREAWNAAAISPDGRVLATVVDSGAVELRAAEEPAAEVDEALAEVLSGYRLDDTAVPRAIQPGEWRVLRDQLFAARPEMFWPPPGDGWFDAEMRREPADGRRLTGLGEWFLRHGRAAQGAALIERGMAAGATTTESRLALARCYWVAGRRADAAREFARVLGENREVGLQAYFRQCLGAVGGGKL